MRESNQKTRKAYDAILVFTVISAICAILALIPAIAGLRYDLNVNASQTLKLDYSKNTSQTGNGTVQLSKGHMYYGWIQKKGDKSCRYKLSRKKTNEAKWTCFENTLLYDLNNTNMPFQSNNKYYGEKSICKINGRTDYNIKCEKIQGKKVTSKIQIDFMLK